MSDREELVLEKINDKLVTNKELSIDMAKIGINSILKEDSQLEKDIKEKLNNERNKNE